MAKGPLQDKDATPLMWFLLGVYSKKLINDRHEIKKPAVLKPTNKTKSKQHEAE